MVLGIVLQIHVGARVGLPARLNTPVRRGRGGARRAPGSAGARSSRALARWAATCGSRSRTRASRAWRRRAYLPPPRRGATRAQCLLVWDRGAATRSRTISARGSGRASACRGPGAPPVGRLTAPYRHAPGRRVSRVLRPSPRGRGALPVTARLGLVALGILGALGLAEGLLRVAAALESRGCGSSPRVARRRPAVAYATLEEFIAAQAAHITPASPWYNYWSNAFGFHDEEFVEPKPAGRLRVLAVGDSFTFGPVPYPQGVMTLTEDGAARGLRRAGPGSPQHGPDGGGAARVPHPRRARRPRASRPTSSWSTLFLGNDPPDLHRYVHDRSPMERALRRSHVWTFAKNLLRARGGLREARLPARVGAAPPGAPVGARGHAGGGRPRARPGRPGAGGAAPLGAGLPAGARLGSRPLLPAGRRTPTHPRRRRRGRRLRSRRDGTQASASDAAARGHRVPR